MYTPPSKLRMLSVAALVAVTASACGLLGDREDSQSATTQSTPVEETTSSETSPVTPTEPPTDDAADDAGTAATDPDPAASDDAATDDEDSPDTGDAGDDAPSTPDAVLAEVTGSPPFSQLEILDLRRDHDAVTVEFAITVLEDQGSTGVADVFAAGPDLFGPLSSDGEAGAADARRNAVSGVTLVDRSGAKRHLVLRDSEGHCLCTRFDGLVRGGERYVHSAQFPAPPAEVTDMTVEVPMFPSIDNVPLRDVS